VQDTVVRDLDSRYVLESEQEDLLATLVERARAVPRQERTFLALAVGYPQSIRGPGGGFAAAFTDVQTLVRQGLLAQLGSERTAMTVAVAPEGFVCYDDMKRRVGGPPRAAR
jgi:hypothetical protein